MKTSFLYLVSMFLISNIVTISSSTTNWTPETDENALLAFKNTITSDPNCVLSSNWSANTSICNWTGVSCSLQNHRVTALNLSGLELVGTIAPHLGNLTFLQYFDISSNNFTGSIPSELSKLHHLNLINVGFNNLIGEIPSWLGALSQLQHIHLNNNSFSGRIPLPLFNISRLQTLDLGYNLLDGNVPEQIADLYSLETLTLVGNGFTGGIPSGIFTNMSSLVEINMRYNKLSGELPTDMCGNTPELRRIYLAGNQLSGQIPASLYKCRKLEDLRLHKNQFSGKIPSEIGNLTMLRILVLHSNLLEGDIPSSIFNISLLESVDLYKNRLSGSIPIINNSPKLTKLIVTDNNLTGHIPKQIGNLTALKMLGLAVNKLTGELPEELGNLAYLEVLDASLNDFLNGSIPSSLFNLSTLKLLGLQTNQFSGSLPTNMGLSLFNLEKLYLHSNRFSGEIPSSISNASKLTVLELQNNSFSGSIPDFGDLRFLQVLRLWENNLTEMRFLSSLTNCRDLKELVISDNPLMNGFVLPAVVGNLSSSLVSFVASNCRIQGVIPSGFGNLSSLQTLDLSENQLEEFIPTTLGKLKQLGNLLLLDNKLRGDIPRDLCLLRKLVNLYLSGNMLTGSIPECLGKVESLREVSFASNKLNSKLPSDFLNLSDLIYLNLSSNYLNGQVPYQVGYLKAINKLDLSFNNFSGYIPNSFPSCKSLEFLFLSNNMFSGSIPESLGEVPLRKLDLSNNHLSGLIPNSLEKLSLESFNASYNQLEGEIPDEGCFANFSAQSFLNNSDLCGPERFQVPSCIRNHRRSTFKGVALIMKYVVLPFIAVMFLVVGILILIRKCRHSSPKNKLPTSNDSSSVGDGRWKIISEREIEKGTNSFSEINLLGKGGIGSVYKATLADGTDVAVKVFNLELEGATKSFDTESRILSTIRHRNLVKILGCCSNNEFKALILTYMPNGSLEKWLHSDKFCVDLGQRVRIAIDVASALEYLHHGNTSPVVHCDIKPSNVLLDADMTAHVGDFGISKLVNDGEAAVHTKNMATIGYAAPEFGSEGKVSTNGDVYSFGILLLEIFTSKRPTDDMFTAKMSIKEWVGKAALQEENGIIEVVAPGLLSREDPHFSVKLQGVKSIFDLAMKCLAFSPEKRINMMQVVASLQKIKTNVTMEEIHKKHI